MNATQYRIEDIRKATLNGRAVKLFKAYQKHGDSFIFCGQFSAPVKTANRDLWKVAAEA